MKYLHLKNKGDTIVEVMVVLAVLGLAVSISYATAHRALLNARQAQENAEATTLVQSQIEALKEMAPTSRLSTPPYTINSNPLLNIYKLSTFCIDTTAVPLQTTTACNQNADGTFTATGRYAIAITYQPGTGPNAAPPYTVDNFTVTANWPDVRATQGTDTVTMDYRVHQ